MNAIVAQIDHWGRPAWITLMVLGFVAFWPVGLVILFYMIRSGRMGCSNWAYAGSNDGRNRWERKMDRMQAKMDRMRSFFGDGRESEALVRRPPHFEPTGNRSFDSYREETLEKLEREADEFRGFLDRLRHAKDKAEFDLFMAERRPAPQRPDDREDRTS